MCVCTNLDVFHMMHHVLLLNLQPLLILLYYALIRDTSLRVFASGGLTAQLGTFTRPVLDYTSASLRLDLGLTSMDFDASNTFKQRVRAGGTCSILGDSVLHVQSHRCAPFPPLLGVRPPSQPLQDPRRHSRLVVDSTSIGRLRWRAAVRGMPLV